MGPHIVIHGLETDRALACRLAARLQAAGCTVTVAVAPPALPAEVIRELELVLWTADSVSDAALLDWVASASWLLELAVGVPPPPLARSRTREPIRLAHAEASLEPLLSEAAAIRRALEALLEREFGGGGGAGGAPTGHAGHGSDEGLDIFGDPLSPSAAGAEPPTAGAEPPEPAPPLPAASPPRSPPPQALPPSAEPPLQMPPAAQMPPADPQPDPVLIAASAPRSCSAGASFTASLAVYVEAAKASALRRLEQLGEDGDRVVDDIAPDGAARWRVGAPVTVRLAGPHLTASPPERRFEWNGRENVAAFSVEVDARAPAGRVQLCFQVELAGVTMAYIPMGVTVAAAPAAPLQAVAGFAAPAAVAVAAPVQAEPQAQAHATLPRTVFASYASRDAALVTQRLSTLARWDPGLDIFEDCLDLKPGSEFSPQLEREIRSRDTFALFWSRNAAASKWVKWEYELRLQARGRDSIVPMPLEDPAIVPPPAEFADTHWRDRFMLAGYALAAIREQVPPPAATPPAPPPPPPPAPPAG